jgi:flagellar motor switch protein FliN/FliY
MSDSDAPEAENLEPETDEAAAAPEAGEAPAKIGDALDLNEFEPTESAGVAASEDDKSASDLTPVFDVPVNISAVLGRSQLSVAELLQLGSGSIVELDRKVGEAIDIYVNNRLVARGEVVIVDERLGVTMTEIIKDGDTTA